MALVLKPHIVGKNPLNIEPILDSVRNFASQRRFGGGYSALDIALLNASLADDTLTENTWFWGDYLYLNYLEQQNDPSVDALNIALMNAAYDSQQSTTPMPEPATLSLLALGALALLRRRSSRKIEA